MTSAKRQAKTGSRLFWLALALIWLAGCFPPSALELDYGNSVRNNLAQTIVNPRAGLEDTPAVGLTPKAGAGEMERYDKSFKGEEKKASEMKQISAY